MSVFFVHGSVETSTETPYIKGLERAALKGWEKLTATESRIDSLEAAINELEDNPLYNAGLGSVLNRDGYVEVDGSIMDGETGKFAAVASMPLIRHAVSVAKKVMLETKHVVLAGEGAFLFAREKGFPVDNCITQEQLQSWQLAMDLQKSGQELVFSPYTGLRKETDTVGCVMLDDRGRLAAASSTGGSFLKLPGRVGDTPFIGGGIFASEHCAVVCTGRGEAFIQTLTAKFVDDGIQAGGHPEQVGREAIRRMFEKTGESGGLLVVDRHGRVAAVHNSDSFPVALVVDGKVKQVEVVQIDT